jgi:two-component system NtrC family sensor kinase
VVEIESRPEAGTTVRLLFPLRKRPARTPATLHDTASRLGAAAPTGTVSPGGGEGRRVLVVEDDLLVQMVTVDGLAEAGFEVVAAATGAEALDMLEREGGDLAAVVTDVVMPGGVSGLDVARTVKRRWPGLAVVLTTGYSAEAIPTSEMPARFAVVSKPFSVDDLAARLRALTDDESGRERDATAA